MEQNKEKRKKKRENEKKMKEKKKEIQTTKKGISFLLDLMFTQQLAEKNVRIVLWL